MSRNTEITTTASYQRTTDTRSQYRPVMAGGAGDVVTTPPPSDECRPLQEESIEPHALARRFEQDARHSIATGDDAEVFNASFYFARATRTSPQAMGQALAVLAKRGVVSRLAVRDWMREGAAALEAQ